MFLAERLRTGGAVLRGVIQEIPSAVATQAIAAAGADFVLIDREHGPISRESMHAMIAATAGTGCAALVRVPGLDKAEVKVALDAGAEGIAYPMIRTVADAERCVAYVNYPPEGSRGFGPFVAHSRFGTTLPGYADEVGPHITCCVFLETAEAVENVDAILAVSGIDVAFVAPFDLSADLGIPGQFDSPAFTGAVDRIERAATAAGVPLGGLALAQEQSAALVARGYRLLVNGIDLLMLKDRVAGFSRWA
jgi:4-hydroxy-2-oxoheptanedioate aldolase